MDKDSKQVVVLLTHPNIKESRANKALMDAISDMGEVAIYNLYEMRVEDAFNAEIWSTIISHASALVFQFPFYWMSAPSLLKRWLDEVFTYLAKTPAVAGKTLMVVTTAGSEHDAYRSGGRESRYWYQVCKRTGLSGIQYYPGIWRLLSGRCIGHQLHRILEWFKPYGQHW